MVLREGRTVLERYWAPYVADDRALVYSASKTFTATAIGLAIAEGRLALDDRIVDLLPEAAPHPADPVVTELTVHHLLSMSTGHDADTLPELEAVAPGEWARAFLATRPQTPVGSRHVYNNGASWLLGELIRRRTGEDLLDYLRPRLLEPLGIEATWDTDPIGRCLGWTGIHLRTRDLAAMGELYRCDGVWQGRRLLPEGWVAAASTAHIPTIEPNPEWGLGYGYQLWLGREGYRLDGAYGQFALVLPERDLVIAITSAQSSTQLLLDLVWEHLVESREPLVEPVGTRPETLVDLAPAPAPAPALPLPGDSGLGQDWSAPGVVPLEEALVENDEPQANLPELIDAHGHRDGSGFRVGFVTGGKAVDLIAGNGEWVRQLATVGGVAVPVAVAAGAAPDGALDVRLVFTDSPHTLRLRLGAAGSAGLAWGTTPLESGWLTGLVAR